MKRSHWLRLLGAALIVLTALPAPARAALPSAPPASGTAGRRPAAAGLPVVEVRADTFGAVLAEDAAAALYAKPSVRLEPGDRLQFAVSVAAAGQYTLAFDMAAAAAAAFGRAPEGQLRVDGDFPVPEARRFVFPIFFHNRSAQFPLDRYGNEALIRQDRLVRWSRAALRDAAFSQAYPPAVTLAAGPHTFEFEAALAPLYLGSLYLTPAAPYPAYADYLAAQPAAEAAGVLIALEAEHPAYKNDTSIRPISSRSLTATPYDTYRLLLNTLGGEAWQRSGTAVYYEVEAPAAGRYLLTLRALQNFKDNFTVYRRITVNGVVPFAELNAVPFNYSPAWANLTLGGAAPYQIYLNQGVNVLGIEATNAPYRLAAERLQQALLDINALALEIKKLTGNQADPFKEWEISEYIPDLQARLLALAGDLQRDKADLLAVNQNAGSQEILAYQMAIDNLEFLAQDPDKIPSRMKRLSEGSGSAAQLLGKVLPSLQSQPLALDKLYLHTPDMTPPAAAAPWYAEVGEGFKRFLRSFEPDPYQTIGAAADELEVWVNRPRQYVDLLQTLTDETFTQDTGIRVKFSIMPEESKLILANAAGLQPDVALGISTNVPYELAIRNALTDLRAFDDFDAYIRIYAPGALLSYIINDSVYAIPETQDFWVTYYRTDILASLGLPVPDTWDQVIEILPELQRYGLNFNTPLSNVSGSKGYLVTAPYLFNHGAQLYSPDGFATGLDSEAAIQAVKFMADGFTLYGLPLTTANFYDSFRYGSLPLGVSNFTDYLKLLTAAPEINGLWGLALYPATVLADGTQYRYATGSAQASIMFRTTQRPDDAWTFMKWWMSTPTQVDFQQQLILNYGLEYLWNSANLEAFQYSPIPEAHKAVILEQWQWLQEPVKLPGSYMQERELSNAWNRIVFDGANPRVALDRSVIVINREITRKMEEFGYLQNGVKVKEFKIPTIETVRGWMAADGD